VTGTAVEVVGAKELRRTLRKAGDDLSDFAQANAEAGRIVAGEAPNWIRSRSGALAGSIRPGAAKTQAVVRAGGARIPYAGVVEWGWPARHIRPRPYLTTAAKVTEPTWTGAYLTRLEAIVGKIKGA
jgi:phage gpG-like protein